MANVRNVNDFVEQLSNCIGEISGDEVVFKKIPYSSEYVVRMRNHNEKVANIWYDYETDKIIVQLVPAFRNMEYSLDDLTIDTIKGIGQMVRKNALNRIGESMEIKEALIILEDAGFVAEEEKPKYDISVFTKVKIHGAKVVENEDSIEINGQAFKFKIYDDLKYEISIRDYLSNRAIPGWKKYTGSYKTTILDKTPEELKKIIVGKANSLRMQRSRW